MSFSYLIVLLSKGSFSGSGFLPKKFSIGRRPDFSWAVIFVFLNIYVFTSYLLVATVPTDTFLCIFTELPHPDADCNTQLTVSLNGTFFIDAYSSSSFFFSSSSFFFSFAVNFFWGNALNILSTFLIVYQLLLMFSDSGLPFAPPSIYFLWQFD